jgi:heme-degrading monooxygenase HmoA
MSYVAINVLTVPEGRGEVLEQRFAARAGSVERAAGFEHFELLRPVEGTDSYLVYTRWRDKADFDAWTSSQAFDRGHAQAAERPPGRAPRRPVRRSGRSTWCSRPTPPDRLAGRPCRSGR